MIPGGFSALSSCDAGQLSDDERKGNNKCDDVREGIVGLMPSPASVVVVRFQEDSLRHSRLANIFDPEECKHDNDDDAFMFDDLTDERYTSLGFVVVVFQWIRECPCHALPRVYIMQKASLNWRSFPIPRP